MTEAVLVDIEQRACNADLYAGTGTGSPVVSLPVREVLALIAEVRRLQRAQE